ncbi:uncharacterized protein LOC124355962 [Homalodisca vitripennis]|uniref:uncharacterized protein LOC124355962 n=1 Tax=Homalodisca vitripennis TaxID=197043 RepID=UPI001EECBEFF|nr:uncharacterized protein LOC124355962 [Homalodisca vitripennis]
MLWIGLWPRPPPQHNTTVTAIHSQTERRSRSTVLRSKDRTEKKRKTQYTARQNVAVAVRSCVVRTGQKRRGRRYVLLCLAAIHSQTERRSRSTVLRSKDRTEEKRKTQYTARQNVAVAVRWCVVRTGQKRRGRRYVLLCLAAIHSQTERRSRSTVVRSKDRTEEKRKAQYTARQKRRSRSTVLRSKDRTEKKRKTQYTARQNVAVTVRFLRSKDRTEKKRKTQYTARQNVAVTVRSCVVRTGQKRRGRRYVLLCLAAIHSQTERRSRSTFLRSKDRTEKKRKTQYTARQNVAVAVRWCVVRTEQKRRGRRYVLLCLAAIHSQTERRSRSTVLRSKDRTEKKRKTVCFVMFGSNTQPDRTSQSQYGAIHSQTERRSRSTVLRSKDRTEEKRKAVCFVTLLPSQVCWLGGHTAVSPRAERRSDSTFLRSKDRTEKKRKTVCFVMFGSNTQPDRTSQSQYGSCVVRTGQKRRGRRYVLLCLAAIHSQTERRSDSTVLRSKDRTEKKRKTQYTARQNVAVAVRWCVVRTEQKRRGRRYVLLCLAAIHSQTERRSRSTVVRSKDRTEEKRKAFNGEVTSRTSCAKVTGDGDAMVLGEELS